MNDLAQVGAPGSAEAILRPIRGGNPFEESVERIVQAIKLGVIPRGERLPPERELAVQLGVSRVTLRAAIRALQQTGYIESRRGRTGGSFVVWDPADGTAEDVLQIAQGMGESLLDALIFRSVLEPGAAALAAQRAPLSGDEAAGLQLRLRETVESAAPAYRLADSRLHLMIAELSGSSSLVAAIADVQLLISDVLHAIPLLHPAVQHSDEQHAAIVGAILDVRVDDARHAMEAHVDATAALLRGFLT